MPSAQEIFDGMPANFKKDAAAGMTAVYQFKLSGDGGGEWNLDIKDGELTVNTGAHDSPSITISMTASDYSDMIEGKLNGQMAFMTGKLKIEGDMSLAMKMQSLFETPS